MDNIQKSVYKHFKGGIYEVLCIVKNSETEEDRVVYKSVSNDSIWVRPINMWYEIVSYKGKKVSRFTRIDN